MKIQKFGQDRIDELTKALIGLSDKDYYWQIMEFLFEKVNLRQPMNQIQKQLLASEIFDAQVNNGGSDQFYHNHQLEYIDDAIDGLKNYALSPYIDKKIACIRDNFELVVKEQIKTGANITHADNRAADAQSSGWRRRPPVPFTL